MSKNVVLNIPLLIFMLFGSVVCSEEPGARFTKDEGGNDVFTLGDQKMLALGIDLFAYAGRYENEPYVKMQLQYARRANCTAVTIPCVWYTMEKVKDTYDFSLIDTFCEMSVAAGMKLIPYWHGTNFAAIDPLFTPEYIRNDKETYKRIVGPNGQPGELIENDKMNCLNCVPMREREVKAYTELVKHIKSQKYANDVLAFIPLSEHNYVGAVGEWGTPQIVYPMLNARCHCDQCNVLYELRKDKYVGEFNNVDFMTDLFADYGKAMVESGLDQWNTPVLAQVCPKSYMRHEYWRYAENPEVLMKQIKHPNFFTAPSVTEAGTVETHIKDMDHFKTLHSHRVFAQGMGIGHALYEGDGAQHVIITNYGGLGGIYWDSAYAVTEYSLADNPRVAQRIRTQFGYLKSIEYHLARLKSSPEKLAYWQPHTPLVNHVLGKFNITIDAEPDTFGTVMLVQPNELVVSGTNFDKNYSVTIKSDENMQQYAYEMGCYDRVSGEWYKYAETPVHIDGKSASITMTGDSGEYWKAALRVYLKTKNNAGGNFAARKSVTCSGFASDHAATNVVDNDPSTFWSPENNRTGFIELDLGEEVRLRNITLSYNNPQTKDYQIFIAENHRKDFSLIKEIVGEKQDRSSLEIGGLARYLRIVYTQSEKTELCNIDIKAEHYDYQIPLSPQYIDIGKDPENNEENKTNRSGTAGTVNLALNRPLNATSAALGFPASNLNDGNPGSKYVALETRHIQLVVDLEERREIKKYIVRHAGGAENNTRDFAILVSDDNVNWNIVDVVLNNEKDISEFYIDAYGRYVMLYVERPKEMKGYVHCVLCEWEIYGNE